jgi:PAS domain S-box-containing protein
MQDLLKHLPAVVYEYAIHPDGKRVFNYISETSQSILGISPLAVMENSMIMDSIVHEEDIANLIETSTESEREASVWNWQGRMMVRGEVKWVEIRSNHEVRNDGVVLRRGIIQDISERMEMLKESELKYQSLVERLPMGIVIYRQNKLVYANAQAHVILGSEKSKDLIDTDVMKFVHPDFQKRITRRMKEVAAGMPAPMVEQKYVRIDGISVDVEAMAFPFMYRGEPCIQVVFRDISERKSTEESIKKNEMLLSQLFQNVPIATVMLDEFGKVQQVNKGFKETFGYELDEVKGKNLNDMIVPEELRNEGIDLNNLITSIKTISVETVRRHKSGRLVSVIIYGVPVMLNNQTIGIYGVYVDITERMRVEEELKTRNTELDNFVYKVSHDLRAPLSSILGLVNLSKLPGNTDNPMDYIEIIGNKVEHLDHFIGDVLSHSKNLKMEVSICRVDLQPVIERTFTELNYLEGAKDMIRTIKIDGIDFYSDPWRISEIFRNLISNAIKYRKIADKESEITIKVHVDNLRVDIAFSDNGIGIEEANLTRIFEMFYRATEQSDGSGIGLYIVKNAVDKLGGQISVASKPGQGTRFNIILPNRINSVISKPTSVVFEQR